MAIAKTIGIQPIVAMVAGKGAVRRYFLQTQQHLQKLKEGRNG